MFCFFKTHLSLTLYLFFPYYTYYTYSFQKKGKPQNNTFFSISQQNNKHETHQSNTQTTMQFNNLPSSLSTFNHLFLLLPTNYHNYSTIKTTTSQHVWFVSFLQQFNFNQSHYSQNLFLSNNKKTINRHFFFFSNISIPK